MKILSELAIITFLTIGMLYNTSADVEDILKAHFEAVGGLERLSEIRTVKRSGDAQVTHFGGQSMHMPGTIETAVAVGKKSYIKTHFEWYSKTTVWNGTEGWKSTLYNGTTALSAMELEIANKRENPYHTISANLRTTRQQCF